MKNQSKIQQFYNNEFGSFDVLVINDKPYFPATECASILGYSNAPDAVRRHCTKDGCVKHAVIDRLGRKQDVRYINEGNLYRLIIRSKLPAAERFERWVFDEVLPSIRKHGAYITQDTLSQMMGSAEFTETLLDALAEEHAKNIALEDKVEELEPRARYCDKVLLSGKALQTSIIAKDYGMTAIAFNRLLHDLGIQYKIGDTWLLYKDYADKGYTKTKTFYTPGGIAVVHTYWLQKGRLFLYETLALAGVYPQTATSRAFIV